MKKLMLPVMLAFSFLSILQAQNAQIKIGVSAVGLSEAYNNPPPTMPGFFIEFENGLSQRFSIFGKTDFSFKNKLVATDTKEKSSHLGLQAGVKFYPVKGLKGFFLGPQLSYSSFNEKLKIGDIKTPSVNPRFPESAFGAGVVIGFNSNINEKLTFGMQASLDVVGANDSYGEGLAKYSLGAGVGWKF